jgi:phosphinothricin acetyltransferase
MIQLRAATEKDLASILDIYNEAVLNTTATFDTEPRSLEKQRAWFFSHKKIHPVLVAEDNGTVLGWASLSPWSDRCAYDTTVEISVYIHKDHRGRGLGSRLLEEVIRLGKNLEIHTVLSRITQGNETSIHIHERCGFKTIGVMKEVGYKFNRFLDVHMMQLIY